MCCLVYLTIWTLDSEVTELDLWESCSFHKFGPNFSWILTWFFSQFLWQILCSTISFWSQFCRNLILFTSLDPISWPNIVATPFQPLFATSAFCHTATPLFLCNNTICKKKRICQPFVCHQIISQWPYIVVWCMPAKISIFCKSFSKALGLEEREGYKKSSGRISLYDVCLQR